MAVLKPNTSGHQRAVGRPKKDGDEKLDQIISKEIAAQLSFSTDLSKEQLDELMKTLNGTLKQYKIDSKESIEEACTLDDNMKILSDFIASKRVENKSNTTLYNYSNEISKMLNIINKPIKEIDSTDIRRYMDYRKTKDGVSTTTIHNIRMYLMSFYKYLVAEEIVYTNPMNKIAPIKMEKKVIDTLTDEEQEMIRCACTNERDLAIIDLLSGSGMRVSELVGLNRSDVNFETGEVKVFGKGSKERICYLTGRAKVHLKWYLDSRTDDNEALFISSRKNRKAGTYSRLSVNSVEKMIRTIGKKTEIENIHPHRFRRTMATRAIGKGMPIEQVQVLLGHTKIDTTLRYANVQQENVRFSHQRFIC